MTTKVSSGCAAASAVAIRIKKEARIICLPNENNTLISEEAAIDKERSAGDERGLLGGEESDRPSDILWLPSSPERSVAHKSQAGACLLQVRSDVRAGWRQDIAG